MITRALLVMAVSTLAGCPASHTPGLGDDDDGGPCEGDDCPASCDAPRAVGDLEYCYDTTADSYTVIVKYTGAGELAIGDSDIRRDGAAVDANADFDPTTQTLTLRGTGLAPSKYSLLFRMKTAAGQDLRPLFIPMWIGSGIKYADFTWRDSIIYQIFTDRFLDGKPGNNLDNSVGDLARVDDPRSRWQGGDFAGITAKIRDGYFDAMGVNTLWISSPILNSHSSQPSVQLSDPRRFASYHSYHPVATGYTHLDDLGYASPIEPAFGTPEELRELVNTAHARGIRIIPDFVTNHLQKEGTLYAQHP
ncbi:MAG: alpha-amylase family glycosyl hydrolase, partial [Kofleriaceae bacterium]